MRHRRVERDGGGSEADFDLPPAFGARAERRMAVRAAASWRAAADSRLPTREAIDIGADSEFAANAILLDLRRGDRVEVLSAGTAVAEAFGLGPGAALAGPQIDLAAPLLDACELIRMTLAAVPIEGAVRGAKCACLLVRGIVMPLADADGRLGFAQGVLNWKEVLDRDAHELLRREFIAAQRASDRAIPQFNRIWSKN